MTERPLRRLSSAMLGLRIAATPGLSPGEIIQWRDDAIDDADLFTQAVLDAFAEADVIVDLHYDDCGVAVTIKGARLKRIVLCEDEPQK